MIIKNIIIAICSLLFFMIGADKFFAFLEPPCTLMSNIPMTIWKILGAIQIISGILIWVPRFRRIIVGFFFVFMLVFTAIHLVEGTSDVGGALFMAALLGLLVWNPPLFNKK